MIKIFRKESLYTKILFYIFVSAMIALLFYAVTMSTLDSYLKEYSNRPESIQEDSRKYAQKLQRYVNVHHLERTDMEKLAGWNDLYWYISIQIYDDSKLYFDSFLHYGSVENEDYYDSFECFSWDGNSHPCFAYPIHFEDGDAFVVLSGAYFFQHENTVSFYSFLVFIVVFVICFLYLCRRRFLYIEEIRRGIEAMCSENPTHEIPIKGHDELTSLACYINDMSQSIQEKIKTEKEIREKNREVVAAISHDIRTPLTSVICYLDLLKDSRYDNKEVMERYLQNARTRAYQIKGMTDELFEQSVQKVKQDKLNWELLSGNELISQVFSEMLYTLREKGFHPEFNFDFKQAFEMRVDVIGFRRIFDNICSNILKYADKTLPILLTTEISGKTLIIVEKNIKSASGFVESTGIGLYNCNKLVRQHKGGMQVKNDGYYFEIRIQFPIV